MAMTYKGPTTWPQIFSGETLQMRVYLKVYTYNGFKFRFVWIPFTQRSWSSWRHCKKKCEVILFFHVLSAAKCESNADDLFTIENQLNSSRKKIEK